MLSENNPRFLLQPWIVVFTAAFFFFYEFIQMNFFDALSPNLLQSFHLTAEQLGLLSANYFYANLLFLFPAGLLLDRFSTRKIILITMTISIIGTFSFASSHFFWQAAICRFLSGIGSAFCFLSSIRLASRWFPSQRMALITGLIVTMAMLGGVIAHAPITVLAQSLGWRQTVMLDSFLGLGLLFLISLTVKDFPKKALSQLDSQCDSEEINIKNIAISDKDSINSASQSISFLFSLKLAYFNLQNWFCGLYTCLVNSPIAILGALWGTLFLEKVHKLSPTEASTVSSMLFIGTIFGSPIFGFLSDRYKHRKPFMALGAILSLFIVCLILYLPVGGCYISALLFLLLGFFTSSQIISYPTVAENNPAFLTGSAVSVVSFSVISGYAIFQPLFGRLMDLKWNHQIVNHQPIYQASDFSTAILLIPALLLIALIISFFIKETYAGSK